MKQLFPWIALCIGLIISLVLWAFNPLAAEADHKLPLLTALLMSEFGFILNASAAGISIRNYFKAASGKFSLLAFPVNLILAMHLLYTGFTLWSGIAG
ncbi:MAG: hypothetical protein V3V12_01640 [Gammaproteobacteria bacterium]